MQSKRLLALVLATGLLAFGAAHAADFGSDRHVARGVQCQTCHGPDLKNPVWPEEKVCLGCHNRDDIAAKTASKLKPNPHKAPHNGDCTLCHMQHEPEVDYCAQCHQFNFQMPNGKKQ